MDPTHRSTSGGRTLNVCDFGATGDGVSDDLVAVQSAAGQLQPGDTLYFPDGRYLSRGTRPANPEDFVEITTSDVTIEGPGTLVQFMFYVHGKAEPLRPLVEAGPPARDDRLVSTDPHGLQPGDYVQLLSQINSYTPDASPFQLGSRSPSSNDLFGVRFTEIQRVAVTQSPTEAIFFGKTLYPGYRGDTDGLREPMAAIESAQYRKLFFVENVTFRRLTFENTSIKSFRGIVARFSRGLTIEACHFRAGALPGFHLRATDSLEIRVRHCNSSRRPEGARGASWNSFIIGGGCQDASFTDNRMTGEWQAIDFTGYLLPNDIGYSDQGTGWSTVQHMTVRDNTFYNCKEATTTHPGTAYFTFSGNEAIGGLTGVRVRSYHNQITNNRLENERTGIALSSFVSCSTIRGNTLRSRPSTTHEGPWIGVHYISTENETMTSNALREVFVTDNVISCVDNHPQSTGVWLSHWLPKSPDFRLFTQKVKIRKSQVNISRNNFTGCSILISRWINGCKVIGNTFGGGSKRKAYVEIDPLAAATTVTQNVFHDRLVPAVHSPEFSGETTDSYTYNPRTVLGPQFSELPLRLEARGYREMPHWPPSPSGDGPRQPI